MLNLQNQRELAYVVAIDAIEPIVGSDNCEAAVVGGWKVMVRKGTFQPNDLAIYFEIDSQVPATPQFEFLAAKHYKVKTQKYTFGGKNPGFYSQGLLMAPSDFGWSSYTDGNGAQYVHNDKKNISYGVGDFLTKELGVTYADPMDNIRKAESKVDKYQQMAKRMSRKFSKQPYRWLMKRSWGQKLLFLLFGRKKDKRSWPAWVIKTDEERCLLGQTKVLTDQGAMSISAIVNQKKPVKVLSMNEEGRLEYKKIIDYQKFSNYKEMITIGYPYQVGTSRLNHLCCTPDHKIFTQRGYVQAKDLTLEDEVFLPSEHLDESCIPMIYGMLLGDSHIAIDKRYGGNVRVVTTQGEKQLDYLKYKQSIFEGAEEKISESRPSENGNAFSSLSTYKLFLPADPYISECIKRDWLVDSKKTVTEKVISKITEESLAYWYMDDGCLSYREDRHNSPSIRLNTQGFTLNEQKLLSQMLLNKFDIKTTIREDKGKYYLIYITTDSTPKFLQKITPYMCKSMAYKTLPQYEYLLESKKPLYKKVQTVVAQKIITIENGQTKISNCPQRPQFVYDIEVEDNHNFIADGIVVHNCQNCPDFLTALPEWFATEKVDGTSTTATMRGYGRKREFYICSRNVCFDTPEKMAKGAYYDTNVYQEMALKYDFENVLADILDKDKKNLEFVTLQGETYGEGIQKRTYNLKSRDFAAFNLIFGYKDGTRKRLNPQEMTAFLTPYGIPCVPIVDAHFKMPATVDELLQITTGESKIDGGMREGLVFRAPDGTMSFKAVSNEFLVKYHQ